MCHTATVPCNRTTHRLITGVNNSDAPSYTNEIELVANF